MSLKLLLKAKKNTIRRKRGRKCMNFSASRTLRWLIWMRKETKMKGNIKVWILLRQLLQLGTHSSPWPSSSSQPSLFIVFWRKSTMNSLANSQRRRRIWQIRRCKLSQLLTAPRKILFKIKAILRMGRTPHVYYLGDLLAPSSSSTGFVPQVSNRFIFLEDCSRLRTARSNTTIPEPLPRTCRPCTVCRCTHPSRKGSLRRTSTTL